MKIETFEDLVNNTATGNLKTQLLKCLASRGPNKGKIKRACKKDAVEMPALQAVLGQLNSMLLNRSQLSQINDNPNLRRQHLKAVQWATYYNILINAITNANMQYSMWGLNNNGKLMVEKFNELINDNLDVIKVFCYSDEDEES